jgi:hypothetical protein
VRKFIEKAFWKVLPFLALTILAIAILQGRERITWDSIIALSVFLFGAALPIFVEMANILHINVLKKQIEQGRSGLVTELERAQANVGKWGRVFFITWTIGALATVVIVLTLVLSRTETRVFPQPTNMSPGSEMHSVLVFLNYASTASVIIAEIETSFA